MNIAQLHSATAPATNRELANRENALLSTGPITPAGKAIVSLNAVTHGIYAQAVLLPHEDKEAFDDLLQRLTAQYAPQDEAAAALVRSLHECRWRITRIRRTEAFLYTLGMREQLPHFADEPDPGMRTGLAQAAAYRADARKFDQLRRHENRLLLEQRDLEARLNALAAVDESAPPEAAPSQPAAPASDAPKAAAATLGFVPSPAANLSPNPIPKFKGPTRDIQRKQWLRANPR